MADPVSPVNDAGRGLDALVTAAGVVILKEGIVPRAASGIDDQVGPTRVATHQDDVAYVPGTDGLVVVGGQADETSPDSVDEGDAGAFRMTLARKQITVSSADTGTLTNVASLDSSATVVAANANRIGLIIWNDDANPLLIKYGATASATSYTWSIAAASGWVMPNPVYRGIIDGIWTVNGAGSARVTELT